jgi:hypothetical protein
MSYIGTTLSPAVQANITQTGTLGHLTVSGNATANNFAPGTAIVVLLGGSSTLTNTSAQIEVLGGTGGTLVLPDATTLTIGWEFFLNNSGSGNVAVDANGGGLLATMPSGSFLQLICTSVSSAAGVWKTSGFIPATSQWGTAGLKLSGTLEVTGNTTLDGTLGVTNGATFGDISIGILAANQISNSVDAEDIFIRPHGAADLSLSNQVLHNPVNIKWYNGTNTHFTRIGTADAQSSDITYVWPTAQEGQGNVLTGDGSGNLKWGSAGNLNLVAASGSDVQIYAGPGGTPNARLLMYAPNRVNYTSFTTSGTTTTNYVWPPTQGSAGNVLTNSDGAGTLTWNATGSTTGQLKSFQILTSGTAATYTKPAGVTNLLVQCIGSGGGGGSYATSGSPAGAAAAGGGGGGFCQKWITGAAGTYTYTVGAGGAGGTAAGNGATGTATTFSTLSAGSGGGGSGTTNSATSSVSGAGGAGGTSSGGDINITGGVGCVGWSSAGSTVTVGGAGAAPPLYGTITQEQTVLSGDHAGTAGVANQGNGGGGACGAGGTLTSQAGGAGGTGLIIVYEYS